MKTTTDRIVKTSLRNLIGAHSTEAWRFLRDPQGCYRAEYWMDITQLPILEQDEYAAAYPGDEDQYPPRFRTLKLAQRWAALMDDAGNIGGLRPRPDALLAWSRDMKALLTKECTS